MPPRKKSSCPNEELPKYLVALKQVRRIFRDNFVESTVRTQILEDLGKHAELLRKRQKRADKEKIISTSLEKTSLELELEEINQLDLSILSTDIDFVDSLLDE